LLDFVREMKNAIKTIGTQWDYLGQYINPNRFEWSVFIAPKQSAVGKVARNIERKIKFGFASAAIFSSPVNIAWLKDMLWWVVLLSKNQVFLRDNKLVERMESQLNDKKYELGLWGWWYQQINTKNIAVLQKIIDSYIAKWVLVPSSKLSPGVSYTQVTAMLTQLLSAAKSFLYFGSLDQFTAMSRSASDKTIFIGFVPAALTNIAREYECARWPMYVCSTEHKSIKTIFSTMWTSLSGDWSSATKTVKDANTRLWQIFSPSQQDDAFKAREADLLRSMYGTKKISAGTFSDSLKKTWAGVKKSWSEVVQQLTGLVTDVRTFRTFPKTINGTLEALPSTTSSLAVSDDITVQLIDSYTADVFLSQTTDLYLVSMSDIQDITPAFKVLWDQVSAIKDTILGGKDKDNSLIWSLWAACELQCGRWWLCR
jgi:hypothetical protein